MVRSAQKFIIRATTQSVDLNSSFRILKKVFKYKRDKNIVEQIIKLNKRINNLLEHLCNRADNISNLSDDGTWEP